MEIGGRFIARSTLLAFVVVVVLVLVVAGGATAYFLTKGSSNKSSSGNNAPTATLETAATQAPTIATGQGAASKVTGAKLSVSVASTPQIQSGQWVVDIAIQGGKNRSQTLGSKRLVVGKPFVVSNSQSGAYTVTPSILNCAKGCAATDKGYTLPPLTIPSGKTATVVVTAKCVKSPLPIGIDCSRSQDLASYK